MRAWLLLLLLTTPAVHARDKGLICTAVLESLELPTDFTSRLEANDIAALEKLFLDPSVSPEALPEAAFNIYIDARLRTLPEHEAAEVRRVLAERVFIRRSKPELTAKKVANKEREFFFPDKNTGGLGDGQYGSDKDPSIRLYETEGYEKSLITFHTLSHEVEHMIQDLALERQGIKGYQPGIWRKLFDGASVDYQRFIEERQAMVAEWEFAHAIPESVRLDLVKRIKADRNIHETQKEDAIRWLENASLDFKSYIEKEHAVGRYTMASLARHRKEDNVRYFFNRKSTGALGILLVGGFQVYCNQEKVKATLKENALFKTLCLPPTGFVKPDYPTRR